MRRDFRRVAIVNRGEAAMRFIRAAREWSEERGTALTTIALYTEPDRRSMFVREADEAVPLGPATFVDPADGRRKSSYLDAAVLEKALGRAAADAVWVGWGFVAERAEFAELCERIGLVFIGPGPEVMRRLGDKIASKRLAEETGVPVVEWSGGAVETVVDAERAASRLGFPLVITASAGGGGRGIREVREPEALAAAFESARAEAIGAFGDGSVFLERLVERAHHVEVQIIADRFGTTWALGVRDCTIQRRHQKVLEESPSPVLDAAQDRELRDAAVRLVRAAGYQNAGTVEFLWESDRRRFAFMEVNARLQVEHPVTEATTGLDLVKLQIDVARGERLEGEPPAVRGHAVEVRLCAEDPENRFAPAPGRIELLRLPAGPGVRVDTGVREGDEIPSAFDSMIAKVIAHGRDRVEALARLRRALAESAVVVRGGTSNKAFLLALLDRAEVRSSSVDNRWLDELAERGQHVAHEHADVALIAAAIASHDAEAALERSRFVASAVRGRPRVGRDVALTAELRLRGEGYRIAVRRVGPDEYVVDPGSERTGADQRRAEGHGAQGAGTRGVAVHVERLGVFERALRCAGRRFRALVVPQGPDILVEVEGVPHRVSLDAGGLVRAPVPGVVLALQVEPGDAVAAGDRVALLEAMKMEVPVLAPFSGRVRSVSVALNVQVDAGAPIVVLEPEALVADTAPHDRVTFAPSLQESREVPERQRWRDACDSLRRLVLGFDVDPTDAKRLAGTWGELANAVPLSDPERERAELEILAAFADVQALFRRGAALESPGEEEGARSPQELLVHYLRALDGCGEGLPPAFLERLRRALAHYGVGSLEHTQELEDALIRIHKSRERADEQVPALFAILEHRLAAPLDGATFAAEGARAILDRLVATARRRFPPVEDLARQVRHRAFDEPIFERARREVYERAEGQLAQLRTERDPGRRAACVSALVDCPQPLVSLLAERFADASESLRETTLEVLMRRYYRIRTLQNVATSTASGQSWAVAEYELEGGRIQLLTTFAPRERLDVAIGALARRVLDVPLEREVVADVYVWDPAPSASAEETVRDLAARLDAASLPRRVRRVVFAIAGAGRGPAMGGMRHFTYRPGELGYVEDRPYRDLHPMMGKRMHLWRLESFDIDRLPSADDVYLFRAVAKRNRKDERLFAIAEVRDATPVRDAEGRVVQIPHLERMLIEALAAVRLAQAHRRPGDRLVWNRVLLYVWPPLELTRDEVSRIAQGLAPLTEGLGLEQVVVRARLPREGGGGFEDAVIRISSAGGSGLRLTIGPPPTQPLRELGPYEQKVVSLRRRGLVYPYDLLETLTPGRDVAPGDLPPGEFIEYDLDASGVLAPVTRARGENSAHVVVGVIRSFVPKAPEGMTRVILLGDPSKEMGSVSEPECRRILAAIDLAERLRVPLEWFALSAGAKISMESGTENMDWVARVLRRLIEFTQAGGEVNVVVAGINVGAQPYWNAEATMLMHTRGILVMTPESAMVLTGKQALDYSGSVSAEDNQGIGGYERIMGPNGQAQYFAADIGEACRILLRHYDHTWIAPGERFPRRAATADPIDRDVCLSSHDAATSHEFVTIGDVFGDVKNKGRKRPFDIRAVMSAVVDRDHLPLERWPHMREAEIAVVWDAHVGGYPVCLLGMESHNVQRFGYAPADGPEHWTAGTLFPRASKKIARAINGASGNRPVVVLANLSGFDGSPESMRNLQLEYGAEIGRAVVNFRGPIVFCVVSRYHGGAFVVFSRALSSSVESAALEGTYASVIGGAPAAAVVFSRDVDTRTREDARVQEAEREITNATTPEGKARCRARLTEVVSAVRSEKLGEVADEFDHVHSVERALRVGSIDRIVAPGRLRPYLVDAIERGLRREVGA